MFPGVSRDDPLSVMLTAYGKIKFKLNDGGRVDDDAAFC